MEKELTTQQLIGNLIKVGHKSLDLYKEDGLRVVRQDPNLFAHLIAWNQEKGEVRDSKVAFPVLSLRGYPGDQKCYYENAVAHLLLLDPRNLLKASYFHRSLNGVKDGAGKLFALGVASYLKVREKNFNWWDRSVLQHRKSMKGLYALYHIAPSMRTQKILFDRRYPSGSVFATLRDLKNMKPQEAAGAILNYKIPFTIAVGAVGGLKNNIDLILALITNMSGAELVTNSKMLQKLGVMDNPVLKAAYDLGMSKVAKDKKVSSLKASRAAEFVDDKKTKAKLEKVQEQRIDGLKGLEGDWLVLGDMSGSMHQAVEKAKEMASVLARTVKGKVYLVFFNTRPVSYDVSGRSLDEIKIMTKGITANGGTSIGCGLQLISDKRISVNGIVIVSDGGENTHPAFNLVYRDYVDREGISPNVYLLRLPGEMDVLSSTMRNLPYEFLDIEGIDYYGMPNLLQLLRSSRYTLIDEIMQVPLLTINEVIRKEGKGDGA